MALNEEQMSKSDGKKIQSSPPFSRQEPVSWRAREVVGGVVPGSGSKVHDDTITRTKCSDDLDSVGAAQRERGNKRIRIRTLEWGLGTSL
jgi:hypothetical protein